LKKRWNHLEVLMDLETLKCPHCGYVYRIDIKKVERDGKTVAVRGSKSNVKPSFSKEMYIDQKCPNCDKEFEWPVK